MSVVFDKLSFTRKLEGEGGFQRSQAERLADAFHDAVGESVATKDDVSRLEARLDGRLQSLEATLDGRIESLEARVDGRIQSLEARLDGRMQSLEARLDGRMQSLEARSDAAVAQSKVWTVGVAVALFSALTAIPFFGH